MTDFFETLQGFDPLNIAFGLNFLSLFMKDILQLRLMALGSQATFWAVGYVRGNWTIVVWQSLFLAINLVRTAMVLWERREIRFSPELERVFREHFPTFPRHEFLQFWEAGEDHLYRDQPIVRQEEKPTWLWFILRGTARVVRDGQEMAQVGVGHFVGEMSFLTDQAASADVLPLGEGVQTRRWSYAALNRIRQGRPALWIRVQGRLGRDLVSKIWARHQLRQETDY